MTYLSPFQNYGGLLKIGGVNPFLTASTTSVLVSHLKQVELSHKRFFKNF